MPINLFSLLLKTINFLTKYLTFILFLISIIKINKDFNKSKENFSIFPFRKILFIKFFLIYQLNYLYPISVASSEFYY
jgi:hypothetical protein